MDRLWYALAAIAALLGAALIIRSLFLDRAKGRKRCPRCWYDMSANAERSILTCSECGRVARSPKQLTRTRRHRRRAALGALILLLALCGIHWIRVREAVASRGWVAAIPTLILVWIAPVDPDPILAWRGEDPKADWSKRNLELWEEMRRREWTTKSGRGVWHWRQDRVLKRKGVFGVDPQDTELVRRMFEDRIESISGTMTAKQAFDTLADRVGVSFVIDWEGMKHWNVHPETLIVLRDLDDSAVSPHHIMEEIIGYTASDPERHWYTGAGWDVAGSKVVHRAWNQTPLSMRAVRYPTQSLYDYQVWTDLELAAQESGESSSEFGGLVSESVFYEHEEDFQERLASLIREFVHIEDWFENGGDRGDIRCDSNSLLILTTPRNHYEIKQLLDELTRRVPRDARGEFVLPTSPRRVKVQ